MKRLIPLITLFVLIGSLFINWTPPSSPQKTNRKFKAQWAAVDANFYVSRFEISIANYNEFLTELKAEERKLYRPDTSKWSTKNGFDDIYTITYHQHPAFRLYPIVNISHQAAIKYCEWLTQKLNQQPESFYQKVVVRLPTEAEWEMAARGEDANALYPWESRGFPRRKRFHSPFRDKKNELRANFKYISQAGILMDETVGREVIGPDSLSYKYAYDGYVATAPVKSFSPNDYGIYNMAGNAAEMLAEKGIAKGGSWASTGYYLRIDRQETYDEPSPRVGFRPVLEIVER